VIRHGDLTSLAQAAALADPARRRRSKSALGLAHAAALHPAFVGARQRGRSAAQRYVRLAQTRRTARIWQLNTGAAAKVAAGILYDAVDASAADAEGVAIVRLAEVNAAELVWPAGITAPEQTTALGELAALTIIAR
jgi:hypothetical protein